MPTHKKGHDKDKYYNLAKDQGYRSRAAFKLIQINKRYDFLRKAKVCIDLCAAPGGWCQVAAKFMPAGSLVLGVDLLPIKAIRGVKTIVGDITTASCRKDIVTELQGWKADVVLCDGAPNIGAAYNKDAYVQNELVLAALKTASDHLNKGGVFCTKVYRSVDYNAIVWALQQLFEDIQTMKPNSSRSQSSEIFLICTGYLAPKSIDARVFDPNYVFKEVADPGLKRPDVLHKKFDVSYKRQRTGYDESLGITLRSTNSVTDFILSKEPVRLLTDINEIHFSTENCQQYFNHPKTTEEVKLALSDLRVLGKIDFKKLLKWRQIMVDTFHKVEQPERKIKEQLPDERDPEEIIQDEIEKMKYMAQEAKRKATKKERKLAGKERIRQSLGMNNNAFEVDQDEELFTLDPKVSVAELAELGDVDLADENNAFAGAMMESSDEEEDQVKGNKKFIEILDPDMEDELEADYVTFMEKRKLKRKFTGEENGEERTKTAKKSAKMESSEYIVDRQLDEDLNNINSDDDVKDRSKARQKSQMALKGDLEEYMNMLSKAGKKKKPEGATAAEGPVSDDDDSDDDVDSDDDAESQDEVYDSEAMSQDGSDDDEQPKSTKNAKAVKAVTRDTNSSKAVASKWFANPIFTTSTMLPEDDEDEDANLPDMPKTDREKRQDKRKKEQERRDRKQTKSNSSLAALEADEVDLSGQQKPFDINKKVNVVSAKAIKTNDFEVVPAEVISTDFQLPARVDTREYDSDNEDYDSHDRIMTLALGTYMLRQSRKKALVDASYNRYSWNDPNALPSWFLDDEMRHNKPQLPVPQALIDQIKNKYQLTGTKVIKKVAEARARKKKRAMLKLKSAKKQASVMAENSELSEKQKLKAISKALRNTKAEKSSKVYVTTKKTKQGSMGASSGGNGKLKFVDKRMKKDKRAMKAKEKRSKR